LALLVENVGDKDLDIIPYLSGNLFVSDVPHDVAPGGWDGFSNLGIGRVWGWPYDLSPMIAGPGSYKVRYEVGDAKSSTITVEVGPAAAKPPAEDKGAPAAVAPAPSPAAADSPRQLVKKLLDPAKRNAALDKLMQLNHYDGGPTDTALVNHVVVYPQPKGEPLYAVFKDENYSVRSGAGLGKPLGHVLLFDSDGKYVPFYQNANSISGVFADVNGDGIVENVEAIFCGLRPAATVICVIPIVEKPVPLLCLAYNPKNRKT
jgi:hypothetical protein